MMGTSYDPPKNWGCILATLVLAPLLVLWWIGALLSGGGCEGAEQPCTPRYLLTWIGSLGIVAAGFAMAWLINRRRSGGRNND